METALKNATVSNNNTPIIPKVVTIETSAQHRRLNLRNVSFFLMISLEKRAAAEKANRTLLNTRGYSFDIKSATETPT
jgi:hypothetical protein